MTNIHIKETVIQKEDHDEFFDKMDGPPNPSNYLVEWKNEQFWNKQRGGFEFDHDIGEFKRKLEATLHKKVIDHIKSVMSNLTIDKVTFDRDVDHDGDPIIRINAFYSKRDDKDMAKNTDKVVRDVRDILDESGDESFPVIRYISIDEWVK